MTNPHPDADPRALDAATADPGFTGTVLTGTVLDGDGTAIGGGLELDAEGVLTRVLPLDPAAPPAGWITPGLIDVHCHGGAGASFPDTTSGDDIARAVGAHRRLGTTAQLASLVSMADPIPVIEALAEAARRGEILGLHLEGPYISPHKCGAQNPAAVRPPDLAELARWLDAGDGHIATMTLAPELDGAHDAARLLLERGARPSWGHTAATARECRDALDATDEAARALGIDGPAQTATHLFNAMPPLGHRDPGPVRELLARARDGGIVVEVVADTVHVDPDLTADVVRWVEAGTGGGAGVAFVSDAMAGAGMPDGAYELGGLAVTIADGVARLTVEGADGTDVPPGAIAGGTARLAEEIARMVGGGHLTMPEAVRACVAAPARALGLGGDEPGVSLRFDVGRPVDLVAFDADLAVTHVSRAGAPVAVGN